MARSAAERAVSLPEPIEALSEEMGRRIRAARLERGMSLAQLGGKDLSRSFLSLVELGKSRISVRALGIVARRLELPMSYFLDEQRGEVETELLLDEAEAALAREQPGKALALLERVGTTEQQRVRKQWLRGQALVDSGRAREAIPVLEQTLAVVEARKDEVMLPEVRYKLASALYVSGAYEEALAEARRALEEASQDGKEPRLLAKITVLIGHILLVQGDSGAAIQHYERARDLFGQVNDLNSIASVYSGLSASYRKSGDVVGAMRYSKMSLGAYKADRDARLAAREMNNIAVQYGELGELEQAESYATDSIAQAREAKARDEEQIARSTLASILLQKEDVEGAEREARQASELDRPGLEVYRADAQKVLAQVAIKRGDTDTADRLYRSVLDSFRQAGHRTKYADAALEYSLLLKERGDTDGALEFALRAAREKEVRAAPG